MNGLLVEYWTQEGPTLAVSVMTAYLSRQRTQIEALSQHVWYFLKEVCCLHYKIIRTELPRLQSPRKRTYCESALCEA